MLALLTAVIVLIGSELGLLAPIDKRIDEARFYLGDRPASGSVVVLDIDAMSQSQVGVWPWPRSLYAQVLDRALAAGASSVTFDIDLSVGSTPAEDAALAAALARAGGKAHLAAFVDDAGNAGAPMLVTPLASLAAVAPPVLVAVKIDGNGLVSAVPTSTALAPGLKGLPETLSGRSAPGEDIRIDFGIDLASIPRFSIKDVLNGTLGPEALSGRNVIIGDATRDARDKFTVARFDDVSGAMIQAAATETLLADRALTDAGPLPAMLLALGAAFPIVWFGRRRGLSGAAQAALLAIVVVEIGAAAAYRQFGWRVPTAAADLSIMAMLLVQAIQDFIIEQSERRRAQARITYLATHDEVTGLSSRRALVEGSPGGPRAVFVVHVRRLDLIRSTLGADLFDQALRVLGQRLNGLNLGRTACLTRDLFAVVIDRSLSEEEIGRYGRILRDRLEAAIAVDGHSLHAAIVSGFAQGSDPVDRLLEKAELAALTASGGRAEPVHQYRPELDDNIERRRKIDAQLREALADGSLQIVFQPQRSLATNELVGVEALARWRDSQLGAVPPADFIPVAEETGLIAPVGHFVLNEACWLAMRWPWKGQVAVNVSPAQFQLWDVPLMVAEALQRSGMPPGRLVIEITESLLMERSDAVRRSLAAIRALGVRIALDDFGTGYSALSYLSDIEFDKLKIDRSFVTALEAGSPRAIVVDSIVKLGRRLGKEIVVEGIETEAERQLMTEIGCQVGQGFLLGRPMSSDDIEALVRGGASPR